jgi:hypothetical protein
MRSAHGEGAQPGVRAPGYLNGVWSRGYGLKDSGKTEATPGKTVNIKAVAATPQEDAEHYPGMYWYSLLNIPGTDQFPGTGDKGNGISPNIKTQEAWVDTVKNSCQSCHALGSHGIRVVHQALGCQSG